MNQEKVGQFIASCRKEQGMTQAALAEKLGITNRAVSKWETGKSLPDASIMLPLCQLLQIQISELFNGERIAMKDYQQKVDELLLELKKQEEVANKKLLSLEMVIGYTASISFLTLVFTASFVQMAIWLRILLIIIATVIFIVGTFTAVKLEHDAGYYECPNCSWTYLPSLKAVFLAPHRGRSRKLTCPHCGKKSYHKKVLTK